MIKCLIVDDEPLAIQLLENHISKIGTLKLIGKAQNAVEAYDILRSTPVDLLFLDIQMPNLNGIEFLRSLSQKPRAIFTTAYREFAIEGFELEAVDYILKPVTFERFFKSVERVIRSIPAINTENFIILKSEGLHRKVVLNEVIYFESQGNDVKVILKNDIMITKNKLADLEATLYNKGFVRIHRSFILNSGHVTAFNNNEVLLGHYSIPVGRSYRREFEQFIIKFSAQRLL